MRLVPGRYPHDGLSYPKIDEKSPFQTRTEIERRIAAEGLVGERAKGLWESLYLEKREVAAVLDAVQARAMHPWIYPLV